MKEKLFVSFSGGRTSAFMCWWLKTNMAHKYEMLFVFANTGQEHENTLRFVDECDRFWGLDVVWVEAITHYNQRRGCTHKVVDFASASRDGAPFEDVIKKYGIPNKSYPHCTRELKLNPMYSYVDSVWGECDYKVAVGIRSDEQGRRSTVDKRIVYPLIDWCPVDKADITGWWEDQEFSLELPERLGNCTWCWKKSDKKLLLNAATNPEIFAFPARMEALYPDRGSQAGGLRVFFRQRRSAEQILAMAREVCPDTRYLERASENSGCSESCEAFLAAVQ